MKITDLKVLQTQGGHANWIFVKLYTNTGLTGVGECSMEKHRLEIVQALESMKDFLVGKDPFQIEHIWNSLYKQTFWFGQLITLCALSGVEQALWDIKGKELGVPVYEFLGGKLRDKVRAYANAWAFFEVSYRSSAGRYTGDRCPQRRRNGIQRLHGDEVGPLPFWRSSDFQRRGKVRHRVRQDSA